jgi:hypothetical protein
MKLNAYTAERLRLSQRIAAAIDRLVARLFGRSA